MTHVLPPNAANKSFVVRFCVHCLFSFAACACIIFVLFFSALIFSFEFPYIVGQIVETWEERATATHKLNENTAHAGRNAPLMFYWYDEKHLIFMVSSVVLCSLYLATIFYAFAQQDALNVFCCAIFWIASESHACMSHHVFTMSSDVRVSQTLCLYSH